MRTRLIFILLGGLALPATGYPPAPFHRIYGSVRDARGNPLATGAATLILSGTGNVEIVRSLSDTGLGTGVNYSLSVPMDSGTSAKLYTVSALRPLLPFTIRVVMDGVSYVPIEMTGANWAIGDPSGSTRIDLTVGIDRDGDGLPDQWEEDLIDSDSTGHIRNLADISPDDDLDGDGLSNLQEYIAGTYALDRRDGISLEIVDIVGNQAHLRFLAIKGRTYSLRSTSDMKTYSPQPFSLLPGASNAAPSYRAGEVRLVDAYVTLSGSRLFFQLTVQ